MTSRLRSSFDRSCAPAPFAGNTDREHRSVKVNRPGTLARVRCTLFGHRWIGGLEERLGDDEHFWACSRCGLTDTDADLDALMTGQAGEAPSPQPASPSRQPGPPR
jgi:hypothetical protein